jgi:hypothetical protein
MAGSVEHGNAVGNTVKGLAEEIELMSVPSRFRRDALQRAAAAPSDHVG